MTDDLAVVTVPIRRSYTRPNNRDHQPPPHPQRCAAGAADQARTASVATTVMPKAAERATQAMCPGKGA
jgi:hypothetical protein